jgi:hypothetical protein
MAGGNGEPRSGIDGHLFRLIATFEAAAMQQLGKIAHPVTGDVEVNLDGARDSIEMLDMVGRKTEGNLNEDEKRLLEHVLYQLRMNYVDVARAEEGAAGGAAAEPTGGEAADDSAESDASGPSGESRGDASGEASGDSAEAEQDADR